jgi:hypothetical protein
VSDTPVYYETIEAWGWEECLLCLMPERPGGHHSHRATEDGWFNPHRDMVRTNAFFRSMYRFAASVTTPERFYIADITEA